MCQSSSPHDSVLLFSNLLQMGEQTCCCYCSNDAWQKKLQLNRNVEYCRWTECNIHRKPFLSSPNHSITTRTSSQRCFWLVINACDLYNKRMGTKRFEVSGLFPLQTYSRMQRNHFNPFLCFIVATRNAGLALSHLRHSAATVVFNQRKRKAPLRLAINHFSSIPGPLPFQQALLTKK